MTHEDFVKLFNIIKDGEVSVSQGEITQMGREMGLEGKQAHYLVSLAIELGKSQVKQEVAKQVDNLFYWVNQR